MEKVIINELKETSYLLADIVELLHDAFGERKTQGIMMGGIDITEEDLSRILQDAVLYIATIGPNLVGMLSARYARRQNRRKMENYCHLGYVAISPKAKRGGIGSQLLARLEEDAKEKGCEYIISNTAEPATSAVSWHLKQGFHKVKYTRWKSRNYNSIVFRKELTPSIRKYLPFISDLLYWRSRIAFKRQSCQTS